MVKKAREKPQKETRKQQILLLGNQKEILSINYENILFAKLLFKKFHKIVKFKKK